MVRWQTPGIVVLLLALMATMLAVPTTAAGSGLSLAIDPTTADIPIPDIWARTDSPAARQGAGRDWLWGPVIHAEAREPYRESPGGARKVFYFDKARIEITDPYADRQSDWYATEGLLVRELITGQIQVGDGTFVASTPADVPVTGDLEHNPESPTYAALARVASVGDDSAAQRRPNRVGQAVTERLSAQGAVEPEGAPLGGVTLSRYDETLGHNVAGVFDRWIQSQPYSQAYVTGLPLTEPYWVRTRLAGESRQVLVQAFERRVLTYTPDNPDGWQVESGNVGLHYRAWRGLAVPDDEQLQPLASSIPWGELIVGAAVEHGLDPYLFAALAKVASGFDPSATARGASGFFGVRPELVAPVDAARLADPAFNAVAAASALVTFGAQGGDWSAALARYYSGGQDPDWADAGLTGFVGAVMATHGELVATFTQAPPPAPLPGQPAVERTPRLVGQGKAAYYAAGYTTDWWETTLARYARWGGAVDGWQFDPNGYYCVHPDFRPGQRLQLTANGVTLWCTIGDTVGQDHVGQWRAHWAVELSWNTFSALGLASNNQVAVRAP